MRWLLLFVVLNFQILDSFSQKEIKNESLSPFLPLRLFFHNDEPNPRTNKPTTTKTYEQTYQSYKRLQEEYRRKYSDELKSDAKEKAKETIDLMFANHVDKGWEELQRFCDSLLVQLEMGKKIELTIKGFASPLTKSNYNVNISLRRINSLINYLNQYKGGVFKKYINKIDPKGGMLVFNKLPFGEYTAGSRVSDELKDTRNSVYNPEAALERRVEIELTNLSDKNEETPEKITTMLVDRQYHDFGQSTKGDKLIHDFVIENNGSEDLKLTDVKVSCGCSIADFPKEVIKPGEKAKVKVTVDTEHLDGKQIKSITILSNSFPYQRRLILTTEVLPKE